MSSPKLRIAMLGIRGIPANYGGFETCVHEIAPRMVAQGHDVTVYCRTPHIDYPEDHFKGVRLVKLPTIQNKYLDTPAHSTLSGIHALRENYDAVFVFGVGNSPVAGMLRFLRTPVVLNVDGLDWTRDKWPSGAKVLLRGAARLAGKLANRTITDSRYVQHFYHHRYGVELDYIPYGADPGEPQLNGTLSKLGIEPNGYFLYVGRFEPENRVHELVEAAGQSGVSTPTVIVGDAPYANEYKEDLFARANGKVHFAGAIYGEGYWELNHHAYAYVFPVASSGTHPALIEAMACGNCLLVQDTPDNRAVGGDSVRYYRRVEELADLMRWAVDKPDEVREFGQRAGQRARELFNWERVTSQYLDLAYDVAKTGKPQPEAAPDLGLTISGGENGSAGRETLVDRLAEITFNDQDACKPATPAEAEALRGAIAIHGLGPLLGGRVERGEAIFGGELDVWLREQARLNRERQAKLREDLTCTLAAFERDNIQAIPLKGTAMLLDRPGEIDWRPMADLDVLVRHEDQRAVDLAYAHAGYCLTQISWKHRVYSRCDALKRPEYFDGEHPDNPRDIESHPELIEMFRGFRWDLTPWVVNNLEEVQGVSKPSAQAMALHLAVHASISALESTLRMIQIVDLSRQLAICGPCSILTAVTKSGSADHARFVYPALALVARWTGAPDVVEAVEKLKPHVPPGMVSWIDQASFYDISWSSRQNRPLLNRLDVWARSPYERAQMMRATLAPSPYHLASAGYDGELPLSVPGWYRRHYWGLISRVREQLSGA